MNAFYGIKLVSVNNGESVVYPDTLALGGAIISRVVILAFSSYSTPCHP